MNNYKNAIEEGRTSLGIELGSTRIKAVLIEGTDCRVIASGSYEWENRLENGIWTYHLEDVYKGIQSAYGRLADMVKGEYGIELENIGSIGISAMMHGYLVFDKHDELLTPFRTWRNTITAEASELLTNELRFHIPQRWSIAHLLNAVMKKEEHVERISFMTSLAGFVHWKLTGERVLGVGEASGMFPIDTSTCDFDEEKLERTEELIKKEGAAIHLRDILPKVLKAGEKAGKLTKEGAALLDASGRLKPGATFAPPEGDAGTGMVATDAVRPGTGNVSAGTSIFGMVVMDKPLARVYDAIDVVTTPDGSPVAMVHCNNCSSEINSWMRMFSQLLTAFGKEVSDSELYSTLFKLSCEGAKDGGGIYAVNYTSGEHITGLSKGIPLVLKKPDSRLELADFMKVLLLSSMSTLKLGFDILTKEEGVRIDSITGHGGLFKTKGVAQEILAGALNTKVSVMDTAGEGGAYGMALLADYCINSDGLSLADYLSTKVFGNVEKTTVAPDRSDAAGFEAFMGGYKKSLMVEKAAVDLFDF